MLRMVHVVLLMGSARQARALSRSLQHEMVLRHAGSRRELQQLLRTSQFDALFCDGHVRNGGKEALKVVRKNNPDMPVVFLPKRSGQREWMKVIESGALNLMEGASTLERRIRAVANRGGHS